jgi:signal transduction histidine kinase
MPTSRPLLSIKLKIVLTFVVAFVAIVGLLLTTGYLMRLLENRVVILEEVSRLEERIQDLRRCEKNLFLYNDTECGQRALDLVTDAKKILAANKVDFDRAFSRERMERFAGRLEDYAEAMSAYLHGQTDAGDTRAAQVDQERIREIGGWLLTYAETIAKRKRRNIRSTIALVNKLQVIQAVLVGVGLLLFGGLVLGKVVHPLKALQDHTQKIGAGDFSEIASPPHELEIAEVYKAFNRMARDLKKREQDLLRSRHLASLGTLLAGVAHELNNPLSNIRSTFQILVEDKDRLDEDFRRMSEQTIIEEVDKAASIVRDLLEVSRGKETSRDYCKLAELVRRTLSLLHGKIRPECEIIVNVGEDQRIFVDEQAILQALVNVISNAIDAIEGEGRIIIEAQQCVDGMVDLVIADTGTGIGEEDLARIFDPFFSTKDVGEGTGLGLFITHQIMERNRGLVQVQSTPGKGTTVMLRIPSEEGPV